MPLTPQDFTPEDTLIAVMIAISISDETIRTSELVSIERMVNHLPVFRDYNMERIKEVWNALFDILAEEDGLDLLWDPRPVSARFLPGEFPLWHDGKVAPPCNQYTPSITFFSSIPNGRTSPTPSQATSWD